MPSKAHLIRVETVLSRSQYKILLARLAGGPKARPKWGQFMKQGGIVLIALILSLSVWPSARGLAAIGGARNAAVSAMSTGARPPLLLAKHHGADDDEDDEQNEGHQHHRHG